MTAGLILAFRYCFSEAPKNVWGQTPLQKRTSPTTTARVQYKIKKNLVVSQGVPTQPRTVPRKDAFKNVNHMK